MNEYPFPCGKHKYIVNCDPGRWEFNTSDIVDKFTPNLASRGPEPNFLLVLKSKSFEHIVANPKKWVRGILEVRVIDDVFDFRHIHGVCRLMKAHFKAIYCRLYRYPL